MLSARCCALALFLASACETDAPNRPPGCSESDACRTDDDCTPTTICESCVCVPTRCAEADECRVDSDCAGRMLCEDCACACPASAQCTSSSDCQEGRGQCQDCACVPTDPGSDPENDCHDQDSAPAACPNGDTDIVEVEASCTAEGATVDVTVASGAPIAEPPGSNQRQCEFLEESPGTGLFLILAQASGGPYACTAMRSDGSGPPQPFTLGAGDSCGLSPDGQTLEFTLSAASAGFPVGGVRVSAVSQDAGGSYFSDSAGAVDLTCPW